MDKTIIGKIEDIIEEAKYMKNSYFWAPPSGAADRRKYEKLHSHEEVAWNEGGNDYTACYTVSCSCRNIYARGEYTRNGKTTTLTAIKNSLNRLKNN